MVRRKSAAVLGVAAAVVALSACGGTDAPLTPMEAHQALTGTNGDGLNGDGLNGNSLGTHVVSVSYASAHRNGTAFDQTWIEGSELVGQHAGTTVRGSDFADVTFTGVSDTGASVQLRVDGATRGTAPDDDVWFYDVSYRNPQDGSWASLCRDASGNPVPTIAVDGWWSYAQGVPGGGAKTVDGQNFTFACKGIGAIGKCIVPFGYKPWASVNGVSVDRYHQACVRMVRADFCGNGQSYTVDGKQIDLYDGLGIQTDTEAWSLEAEWDENGARCFSSYNRASTAVSCDANRAQVTTCGDPSDFGTGALLMDEIPPAG